MGKSLELTGTRGLSKLLIVVTVTVCILFVLGLLIFEFITNEKFSTI
jgi:preprotein translocase subunit SecG